VEELRAELEEAEGFNDPVRAARARQELDFLAGELALLVISEIPRTCSSKFPT
jgi:hypothetical protein